MRPGLVARHALLARLDACRHNALTILSAPAGYGKTTLLTQWIATRMQDARASLHAEPAAHGDGSSFRPASFHCAWVALDADDSDPSRFWSYVLAALGRALHELPSDLRAPLQAPQPQVEAVVAALANALAALPDEVVLILDDYHTISSLEIHRSLATLVEHRPPGLHVVVAGRADPSLPLARLRAQGLLHTLRATDLRFTSAETAAFLNGTMGLDLSAEAVAALEGYTEGWPAGLQLAALWLRDHPEAAEGGVAALADEDRYLIEFLAEEVIQRQSAEVQRFLLDTALLDRLCPELCDYLTADARRPEDGGPPLIVRPSDALLAELVQRNLFVVPLDAHGQWYRYHTLFGDALRRQLGRRRGAATVSRLHRRAAGWFAAASAEDAALLGEALRHALASKAYDLAADLILPRADQLAAQGHIGELIAWLTALPEAALVARPALALRYAWVLFLHGRQDEAARWLEVGEAGLGEQTAAAEPLTAALPDVIKAAMATTRHDDEATLAHATRAAALLPPDEPIWHATVEIARGLAHHVRGEARAAAVALQQAANMADRTGNSYGVMISNWHLAQVRLGQARLEEASRALRRIAAIGSTYNGYTAVGLALVAYEHNDLPTAHALVTEGLQQLEATGGQPRVILCAHALLARLARAAGDPAAALTWLDAGAALARRLELAEDLAVLEALRADFAAADGDLRAVDEWVAGAGLDPTHPDVRRQAEQLTLARTLAIRGRSGDALRLVGGLLAAAEATGRTQMVIACELIRALAQAGAGQTAGARVAVATALALAAPEGIIRPFHDAGPVVAELIADLRSDPRAADPVTALARGLAALGNGRSLVGPAAPAPRPADNGYEALSERELRVLALIAADCSNQEIASALIVSVNTIKTHIKRIYEKLQVNSRIGAVARARELGMLR